VNSETGLKENSASRFALAGNGSYGNRGCEAIVRGTMVILEAAFEAPEIDAVSIFSSDEAFRLQKQNEIDHRIGHGQFHHPRERLSGEWIKQRLVGLLSTEKRQSVVLRDLNQVLPNVAGVLSVGGDNYAVENDRLPWPYIQLDDFVRKNGKPLVIWGASVGPFDRRPEFESYMKEHLAGIPVFARESATVEYLHSLGLGKWVYPVADPAFVMKPELPAASTFDSHQSEATIGVNFSPLVGKYVTGPNRSAWVKRCADIIDAVAKSTAERILLIPHVTHHVWDDWQFMKEVLEKSGVEDDQISLLPMAYSAAELKSIISRLQVFVGMRMHATIAAISSAVPTINIAYSIKARGLSRDMNGHEDYCLLPEEMEPELVAERIAHLWEKREEAAKVLEKNLPPVRAQAMKAGEFLKEILSAG